MDSIRVEPCLALPAVDLGAIQIKLLTSHYLYLHPRQGKWSVLDHAVRSTAQHWIPLLTVDGGWTSNPPLGPPPFHIPQLNGSYGVGVIRFALLCSSPTSRDSI